MAAPTIAIIAYEPGALMGPVPVGYALDDSTFVSGDGALIDDCMFYWFVTARGASNTDTIPDRYRKVRDERMLSAEGMVEMAGLAISTIVDLIGASTGRARNLVPGYSQNYILTEGEWTINLVCINPSGESTTASRDVTVVADTRATNTLKASGGDHADWTSALTWLGGADSRKLIVDRGFSGSVSGVSGRIRPDRNYWVITTDDPTDTATAIAEHDNTTGATDRFVEFPQAKQGSLIENIDLLPSARAVSSGTDGVRLRGNNCAMVNCQVLNNPIDDATYFAGPFDFTSSSQATSGNLLFNCRSSGCAGSGNYSAMLSGTNNQTNNHIYGGVYEASVNESIFRTLVSGSGVIKGMKIMYGLYDNSRAASKSTIRYTYPTYSNLVGSMCIDGAVEFGSQTGGGSGTLLENHNTMDGVWSTGVGSSGNNINVKPDASHIRLRNCYAGDEGISLGAGTQPGVNDRNDYVRAYNCTSRGNISSPLDPTAVGGLVGIEIKGCIMTAGIFAIDTSGFAAGAISDNRINGTFSADSSPKTLSEWNALPAVGTDYQGVTTIEAFGYPSTSIETMSRLANNPIDMWGFDRDATTLIGCTNSLYVAPASSASTTVSVNADGTIHVVVVSDDPWAVPVGIDGKTLTLLVDGSRTIEADTDSVSVVVSGSFLIATVDFSADGSIYAGEAVEILLCEEGIISDGSILSPAVTTGTTVTNNSTIPNLSPDLAFEISASPVADGATVNIGDTLAVDSIASVTITIENSGTGDAAIGTIVATGDASIDAGDNPSNTTLNAAASTTVTVDLDTSAVGGISGTISIPSDDASSPFDLTITGTVVAPSLAISDLSGVLASGDTIALGDDIDQGESVTVSLTIENVGTGIATIGTIESTGVVIVDGIDNPSGTTLAVDATDTLALSIDTSGEGAIAGTLSIPSDDPASPFTLSFAGIVIAPEVIPDNNPGPSTRQAYLSVVEADGIIDEMLLGAQLMKQAWASLTTEDKLKCIANASIDFDSVAWIGLKQTVDQSTAWRRIDRHGELILPMGEPQLPTGVNTGTWSFAGLPREIRIGVAIQAAARAAQALSLDIDAETLGRAAMGITGLSGSGMTVSADPVAARRATSNLHWSVLRIVSKYLVRTVNFS